MLLYDLMDAARTEAGYPTLPIINWDKWIKVYERDKDKFLHYTEDGFIAGQITDSYMLLDGAIVALEVAWYVTPEKRTQGIGMELYKKFYDWALEKGCEFILQGRPTKGTKKVGPFYLKELV